MPRSRCKSIPEVVGVTTRLPMINEQPKVLDFEDPVEATGCQRENDSVLLCYDEHKDWRKCRQVLDVFRRCIEQYQAARERNHQL